MTNNQATLLGIYAEMNYRLINHITLVVNDYPEESLVEEILKLNKINELLREL